MGDQEAAQYCTGREHPGKALGRSAVSSSWFSARPKPWFCVSQPALTWYMREVPAGEVPRNPSWRQPCSTGGPTLLAQVAWCQSLPLVPVDTAAAGVLAPRMWEVPEKSLGPRGSVCAGQSALSRGPCALAFAQSGEQGLGL